MKTDELRTSLAAIERQLATRTVVVRVVIDAGGRELRRITRTVQRPRTNEQRRIYD
jgi:hypothetical protein